MGAETSQWLREWHPLPYPHNTDRNRKAHQA
jgi:hypothetical protein